MGWDLALAYALVDSVSVKLRKVSGCENGTCPTVYISDRGTAVIQGDVATSGSSLASRSRKATTRHGMTPCGHSAMPIRRSAEWGPVCQPSTDYQRFQLAWAIPGNIDAGVDIRILDLTDLDLDLPSQDFWLFDEETVVDLNFRPDGTLVNVDRLEDPNLGQYLKRRDTAVAHAVPFSSWNART